MLGVVIAALLRASAFAALFVVARFFPKPEDVVGANVGLGILLFALYVFLSALWSFADGLAKPLRQNLTVWLLTAVVVGVAQPFLSILEPGATSWSVIASDLAMVTPFIAALVALPSSLAAWLVAKWVSMDPESDTGRHRTPATSPSTGHANGL